MYNLNSSGGRAATLKSVYARRHINNSNWPCVGQSYDKSLIGAAPLVSNCPGDKKFQVYNELRP